MPDGLGLDEDIHSLWVWLVCTDQHYYILCQSASSSFKVLHYSCVYIYVLYWIVFASDVSVY